MPVTFALNAQNEITVHLGESSGIQLPATVIVGILAAVTFCRENRDFTGRSECYLSWEHPGAGDYPPRFEKFIVEEWWGRKRDFLELTRAPQSLFTVSPTRTWTINVAHEKLPITFSY